MGGRGRPQRKPGETGKECRTDCVERPLSRLLGRVGAAVGAWPWPFLLLPLTLSAALGVGFNQLPLRKNYNFKDQFTPRGGQAKAERRLVRETFPTDDSERFSAQRLTDDGLYAAFVAVATQPSILTADAFTELLVLDAAVRRIISPEGLMYDQLCAFRHGKCNSPHPLLDAIGDDPARIEALLPNLTFPLWQRRIFLGFVLGGVTLGPGLANDTSRPVRSAKALRLFYYLEEDDPLERAVSLEWLKTFLEQIHGLLDSLRFTSVRVTQFSSISSQEEFENEAEGDVPLFYITYAIILYIFILSFARLDCVRTKVWVAVFGALSSVQAVVSSFGLLLFCGTPFVITAATAPFLILGVGVLDKFILLSCWLETQVKDTVKDRMAATYAEAAVSITITTLTNVLAFYICIITVIPAVQSFCLYIGTAFVFCYIYNLTFLGAILALNGRREEKNRHWLTCKKLPVEVQDSRSSAYNMCCVGGSYDETTGTEHEHPMNFFFRQYFGPFLVDTGTKVFVVILYLGYLGSSIYGCTWVRNSMDFRDLASSDSYITQYYDWTDAYFKDYGPRVMVVVTKSIPYWNPAVREDLEKCVQLIENSEYIDKYLTESWLRIYVMAANTMGQNIDNQNNFLRNLPLLYNVNPDSQWDLNFTNQEISASRFFIQTVSITTAADEQNLLIELRTLTAHCKIPLIVYHPDFIFFDMYLVLYRSTIQNVVIVAGAMLLISLLLIPNPLCSLLVTFAFVSINAGVVGFMAYWGVSLDPISIISLLICIGFSVAFSAHISYAFVRSEKSNVNDKAVDALFHCGYAVIQGAVSTIMALPMFSMAITYIFRTFFKIMFLVMLFGAVHTLIFIPVFLTFLGFCQRCGQPKASAEIVNNPEETPMKTFQEHDSKL